MLTLYVKTGCPFCAKVLNKIEELGLEIEQRNIADEAVTAELIEKGGERKVPFLVDTERGVSMYESNDIVAHLDRHYGTEEAPQTSDTI